MKRLALPLVALLFHFAAIPAQATTADPPADDPPAALIDAVATAISHAPRADAPRYASLGLAVAAALTEDHKLIASDAAAGDNFGISVSLSGDRALVGAFLDDDDGVLGTGLAYVFDFDGEDWSQTSKLTASDAFAGDQFGHSVSLSGDRALVGANGDDDDGSRSGSAYVFDLTTCGAACNETSKLTASDAGTGDRFGQSVSLSGDRALVGAQFDDDGGTSSGSAYVFDLTTCEAACTEASKLTASDAAVVDQFGISVSLSGDRALVGALQDDDGGFNSGSAYVFDLITCGATCNEASKLTASDAAADDRFGFSVSLSGDRALVGAILDDGGAGSAYVFDFDGVAWIETKLTASDADANDFFGFSVSLSGDRALVGAIGDDDAGSLSGSAYVFDLTTCEAACTEASKLTASDAAAGDQFGQSVSLSGDRALVGAHFDGGGAGSAYVFDLVANQPPVADAGEDQTVVAGQTATLDGSGSSDPDDDDLTYAWGFSAPGGSSATLDDATAIGPLFCTDETGAYTATLVVNDGTDDSDADDVLVTAISATEALDNLIADVEALGPDGDGTLNKGQVRGLTRNLVRAQRQLGRGHTNGALDVLAGFRQQAFDLEADGVLSEAQREALVASVDAIIGAVGSPCGAAPFAETAPPAASSTAGSPDVFALNAAYPNPFNPSATLSFDLPESALARLVVYDALGREVARLADGTFEAGRHEVSFDASDLPSGVYFARFTAGSGFAQTRRMTLLK